MGGNRWIEHDLAVPFKGSQRSDLVGAHQARIPDYVGCQYCRKPAIDARFSHEQFRQKKADARLDAAQTLSCEFG
jgi:hypothetical protein